MNRPEQGSGDKNRNHRGGRHRKRHHNRSRGDRPEGQGQQRQPSQQRPPHHGGGESQTPAPHVAKPAPERPLVTYGVVFYDSLSHARADFARLEELASQFDRLNIVIKAEGEWDDPDLTQYGKVFAGAAWTLIHERRIADGWYNEKHI